MAGADGRDWTYEDQEADEYARRSHDRQADLAEPAAARGGRDAAGGGEDPQGGHRGEADALGATAANGLLLPREGELAISHHGGFLKADERRIQYERISRDRGERRDYAVRLDPEKEGGYVVVQL